MVTLPDPHLLDFRTLLLVLTDHADGMPTAYLRGRKLHGKTVRIPDDYRGILAQRQDDMGANEAERPEGDHPDGQDVAREGEMQIMGEFQDIVIWGHESVAEPSTDHHIRGMEEWMEVSKRVRRHGF